MDERSKWTPEQLEILEILRSKEGASSDPALSSTARALEDCPEMAQRLERIQKWDVRISEALHDVAPPPGLAEQILQSLEPPVDGPVPAPVPSQTRHRRRRWMVIGTGVGLAIALLVVALLGQPLPNIAPEALCSIARDRFVQDRNIEAPGLDVAENTPSDRFPYSHDLIEVPGTRWQFVPSFQRAKTVAYSIPLGPNQKATLYVVRCHSNRLPQRPPRFPQLQTQGLAIAAWQANDVVYVAVVEGNDTVPAEATYRLLIRASSQQLT